MISDWHRAAHTEFPSWATVRLAFVMNERKGWRRDLSRRLNMAKPNVARLLRRVETPTYPHYLGVVDFLHERGVHIIIPLTPPPPPLSEPSEKTTPTQNEGEPT